MMKKNKKKLPKQPKNRKTAFKICNWKTQGCFGCSIYLYYYQLDCLNLGFSLFKIPVG